MHIIMKVPISLYRPYEPLFPMPLNFLCFKFVSFVSGINAPRFILRSMGILPSVVTF